jgi:hypothetical protein
MVSLSIIGMTGWVNPFFWLFGALGPSPSYGEVWGRLFLWTPSELCPLGAPSWGGEAHGGAPLCVTLQAGPRARHRPARPGCKPDVHTKSPARSSAPTMAARTGLDRARRGALQTRMGA